MTSCNLIAYAAAHYEVELPGGRVVLTLTGLYAGEPGILPDTSLTVVTAYNPGAERPGAVTNEAANARLRRELDQRGQPYHPARGYNVERTHTEPSFAVAGLSREASVALGQQFHQAAVFYWTGTLGELLWCAPS